MNLSRYFSVLVFVLLSNLLTAQTDTVYIIPNQTIVGDQVRVDFPVQQFEGIACLQYTMNYDPDILLFDNFGNVNLPDLGPNNFGNPEPGKITFSWLDYTTLGVTRADGESIYSVFFSMAGGAGVSELYIDGSFKMVEACIPTGVIPLIFNNITRASFVTSNENIEETVDVKVFPNPATEQVNFDISNVQGAVKVEIYNSVGQLISNHDIENKSLSLQKTNKMGAGNYHYRLIAGDQLIKVGKFTLL